MGRTTLKLDTKGFEELMNQYKRLGGDAKQIVEKALEKVGDEIARDTEAAVAKKNLPPEETPRVFFRIQGFLQKFCIGWAANTFPRRGN